MQDKSKVPRKAPIDGTSQQQPPNSTPSMG